MKGNIAYYPLNIYIEFENDISQYFDKLTKYTEDIYEIFCKDLANPYYKNTPIIEMLNNKTITFKISTKFECYYQSSSYMEPEDLDFECLEEKLLPMVDKGESYELEDTHKEMLKWVFERYTNELNNLKVKYIYMDNWWDNDDSPLFSELCDMARYSSEEWDIYDEYSYFS